MRRLVVLAAFLVPLILASAPAAWADSPAGEDVFQSYCGGCHSPQTAALDSGVPDLRQLNAHASSLQPWSHLARRIDPPPDRLRERRGDGCNQHLKAAFSNQRFAWNIRRGTLFEIFGFLEGVRH